MKTKREQKAKVAVLAVLAAAMSAALHGVSIETPKSTGGRMEKRISSAGFPVKPLTCYEATFRVRVAKGMTVEDSPQLADLVPVAASRSSYLGLGFSSVQWRFVDAAGKEIPRPREGASPQTLFSREWRTCRYRFWTPENAARFEMFARVGRKGDKVDLADLEVHEVVKPETLNFNGDLSADADIPWGWQMVGAALFLHLPSGRAAVNVAEGTARCDLFPVTPGRRVKVAACGGSSILPDCTDHRSTNVRIAFFSTFAEASTNCNSGEVAVALKGKNASAASSVRVPEGKRWARLSVWNGMLEKAEVTEVEK